jgi:hypothetical protein
MSGDTGCPVLALKLSRFQYAEECSLQSLKRVSELDSGIAPPRL